MAFQNVASYHVKTTGKDPRNNFKSGQKFECQSGKSIWLVFASKIWGELRGSHQSASSSFLPEKGNNNWFVAVLQAALLYSGGSDQKHKRKVVCFLVSSNTVYIFIQAY